MLKKVTNRKEASKHLERVSTSDLYVSDPITAANVNDATKALSSVLRGGAYLTVIVVRQK